MSSSSPSHPAYYISRRQLWTSLPVVGQARCLRWLRRIGFARNCDSLASFWHAVLVVVAIIWLSSRAAVRYTEFKSQAYNPRYGAEWQENGPLHLQLSVLLIGLALLPVISYATLFTTGNAANDSIVFGRDLFHLQGLVTSFPTIKRLLQTSASPASSTSTNANANNIPSTTIKSPTSGGSQSWDNTDLDSFLLKRRGRDFLALLGHNLRPFSTLFFVLATYTFLLPVTVMEAEQLKHEVIHPRYVTHSNLDVLFGHSTFYTQSFKSDPRETLEGIKVGLLRYDQEDSSFAIGHQYLIQPPDVSLEYGFFCLALAILTIRYAAPFYFTSRAFTFIFTAFCAFTALFLLIDSAALSIVCKLASVGIRQPGGEVVQEFDLSGYLLGPWTCLALSAIDVLLVLTNLASIYAYGEEKFYRAVGNYVHLLTSQELPSTGSSSDKHGDQPEVGDYPNSFAPEPKSPVQTEIDGTSTPITNGMLPLTLAITTKKWRWSKAKQRSSNATPGRPSTRANTPMSGQYFSNDSEMSSTFKRSRTIDGGLSSGIERRASVHTLLENSKGSSRRNRFCSTCVMVGATTFVAFIISRICLASFVLSCYWQFKIGLLCVNIVVTILYTVVWMLIWFCLGAKNSWRYRVLHTVPSCPNVNGGHPKLVNGVGCNYDAVNQYGLQTYPMAYPTFWPYVAYPSWMAPGINAPLAAAIDQSTYQLHTASNKIDPLHEGESGGHGGTDSLYGCFQDMQTPVVGPELAMQYRSTAHEVNLGSDVRTPSNDSDFTCDGVDGKYFKPIKPDRLMGRFDNNDTTRINYTQPDFSNPATSNNLLRIPSAQAPEPPTFTKRNGRSPDAGNEPAYATLATINKQLGQAFRSQSVASNHLPSGAKSYELNGFKRSNSRVTFKDNSHQGQQTLYQSTDFNYRSASQDAAGAGSSDSGVCTGNGGMASKPDDQYQHYQFQHHQQKQLVNRGGSNDQFTRYNHQSNAETGRLTALAGQIDQRPNLEVNSFGTFGRKGRLNGAGGEPRLYSISTNQNEIKSFEDSNDHLCSQV